jgi:hypothetical protein
VATKPGDGATESLRDLREQLLEARKSAVSQPRPVNDESPDWPDPDEVTWEEATTRLGIEMFLNGAKVGFGVTADGQSIWARIGYPKWSMRNDLNGQSALTFSSDLDRAVRKLCQLTDNVAAAKFKPDPYAK